MSKISKNGTAYRAMFVFIGTLIISFGISLSVRAGLGTDPYTCLNMGFSKITGMSFGTCQLIANIIIVIMPLIFGKKYIGLGTLVNIIFGGYIVDFFGFLYTFLPEKSVVEEILLMIIGLFITGYGVAMYMEANMGIPPYDALGLIISKKTKKAYSIVRMIQDLICVVIGFLLGSTVGIATILTAFLLGYLITYYRKQIHAQFFN